MTFQSWLNTYTTENIEVLEDGNCRDITTGETLDLNSERILNLIADMIEHQGE